MSKDDIVVGIDFGATNSVACIYKDNKFEIIPSALGNDFFPSVVAVNENGELLVGHYAQKQMPINAKDSVSCVKVSMGKNEFIEFNGKDVRPQVISALILAHIKRDAESYLSKPIKKAVISVPASFDDDARKATFEAGQIAGFEVEAIVNEPTAACLAYATIKDIMGNILVFDIGGGTLDITVGSFDGSELVPQSTVGYRVGGRYITIALRDYVQKEFEKINGLKLEDYVTPDYSPIVALTEAVETAKIELSSTKTTKIYIPSIVVTEEGERINLDMEVNRSKLNELSNFVIERCEQGIADALREANLTKEDIDHLIFVGDSINVSLIRESVERTLGVSAIEGVDPSLCVAQGASLYLSDSITVPVEVNSFTPSLFFDEKLIKDLSSKFNGLTIENERTLNNILYSSKDYDISFKELGELIRENVLDGNESIESFYKKLENFINSRINEKNRKLNRFEDMNKKLKMENECLKEKIDLLVNENLDLNYKIKKLKDDK